jgi:hypothetical protein
MIMIGRLIFLAAVGAWTAGALAAPSVVSDPTTRTDVTHCAWYIDNQPRALQEAPKDSAGNPYCLIDVAELSAGPHVMTVAFVVQDVVWGELEGPASAPFEFARPASPDAPTGLVIRAQLTAM